MKMRNLPTRTFRIVPPDTRAALDVLGRKLGKTAMDKGTYVNDANIPFSKDIGLASPPIKFAFASVRTGFNL